MAQVVGGFMLPHDPLIAAIPDAPPERQRAVVSNTYAHIARRLETLRVDTIIVIGDDHYTMNSPACIPRCLIGIGDVEGPWESWLNIERSMFPNNEPLATHIMHEGFASDVDWAVAKALVLDHSVTIPLHYAVRPVKGLRSIPVYLNSGVEPLISNQRCYRIGQVIGAAVASWPGNERVAILGTGGISHWPGMAEMGKVNEPWDRRIINLVEAGDVQALIEMSDEEILREGGNGGLEIKNWICAMGAMGDVRGELLAYEPIPEWVCGCGFLEMMQVTADALALP